MRCKMDSAKNFNSGRQFWSFAFCFLFLFLGMGEPPFSTLAQTLSGILPVTNGDVKTLYQSGDSLYIGGTFTYVGKNCGSAVLIDPSNEINPVEEIFPKTNGIVYASCPDGNGGWFIGGKFTSVGGTARQNLAHIKSDYSVDPVWNPTINSEVYAVAINNGILYIGGMFDNVNSSSRWALAAFDTSTASLTSWNPKAIGQFGATGQINTLTFTSTTVIVGGVFTHLNSTLASNARSCLGEVNISDGVVTQFNNTPFNYWDWINGSSATGNFTYTKINKLNYNNNDTLYVLGVFNLNNYNCGIASIKYSTNEITTWDPTVGAQLTDPLPTYEFYDIQIKGDTVYLGGVFNTIVDPQDAATLLTRNNLMAVSRSVTLSPGFTNNYGMTVYAPVIYGWDPNIQGSVVSYESAVITGLVTIGDTVYAAGTFNNVGGTAHQNLVGIDANTGSVTWDPNVNSSDGTGQKGISTLSTTNGKLLAGGTISSYGGSYRKGLAKILITTGNIDAWNPNLSPGTSTYPRVSTLDGNGGTLFISGDFSAVGGTSRNSFAAIDGNTGNATTFNVATIPNNSIYHLQVFNNNLYMSGGFSSIGGQTRYGLAAIDLNTTTVTGWNPNPSTPNGNINSFVINGTTLYACGTFDNLGGLARGAIGAVDINTGSISSWHPTLETGKKARAITYANNTVFIGGAFTTVNGTPRNYIAALDPATAALTSWTPGTIYSSSSTDGSSGLYSLTASPDGTMLFAGGSIDSVGGAPTQKGMVELSLSTGAIQGWNPGIAVNNGLVEVHSLLMDAGGQNLYVSGLFGAVSTEPRSNLAGFSFSPALPVELTSFTAEIKNMEVSLKWNTATETNNYGFEVEKSIRNYELGIKKWAKIGFVKGNGNSNSPKEYGYTDKSETMGKYLYRLKQVDNNGKCEYSKEVEIDLRMPNEFSLEQNYPNPFNPGTTVKYSIPADGLVNLTVYNMLGEKVENLINQNMKAGRHEIKFNASKYASGIYFYRLESGQFISVKKMIILK